MLPIISTSSTYAKLLYDIKFSSSYQWGTSQPEVGRCQGSAHSFRGRGKTYQSNDFVCLISCPNCCPCSGRQMSVLCCPKWWFLIVPTGKAWQWFNYRISDIIRRGQRSVLTSPTACRIGAVCLPVLVPAASVPVPIGSILSPTGSAWLSGRISTKENKDKLKNHWYGAILNCP